MSLTARDTRRCMESLYILATQCGNARIRKENYTKVKSFLDQATYALDIQCKTDDLGARWIDKEEHANGETEKKHSTG